MASDFNEFDLIVKYLGTVGHRVMDVRYFREQMIIAGAAGYDIGAAQGFVPNQQFFFGNISISITMSGVIVLTNENLISTVLSTLLFGHLEIQDIRVLLGVNLGMNLMGNGYYIGEKRIYGLGCNRISVQFVGIGAAVIDLWAGFNGYMFTVI